MGRSMKNLDTELFLPRGCGFGQLRSAVRSGSRSLNRLHFHALFDFLYSLSNHVLTGPKALLNQPESADLSAGLHVVNRDSVVGVDRRHLILTLNFKDRALRNQYRIMLN